MRHEDRDGHVPEERARDAAHQQLAHARMLGEAEDMGEVVSLNETVSVPYGDFTGALMTYDFAPVEPDVLEAKFYVPGVGLVLEVDQETGERAELVDVVTP